MHVEGSGIWIECCRILSEYFEAPGYRQRPVKEHELGRVNVYYT